MLEIVQETLQNIVVTQQLAPVSPFPLLNWTWRGQNIRYTVLGSGRPLILIHGFGAAIGHWRNNLPVLAAAGYRVFALDLLGFGASDKPALDYDLDLWVDLLKDFCAEQVKEPAIFVGNSIGALLSLMVLADAPHLSAGGILLNAAGGLNHRPDELALPLRLVMGTFTRLVGSDLVGPFLFNLVRQKPRIRRSLQQVYHDQTAITDELVDLLYQPSCHPGAQKVFASILTAPPGPRPSDLLPNIDQPLLVLWGEADPWTPIAGAKLYQDLAAQHQQVQFISIPDTGHCPHDERPVEVNRLILEWLKNLDAHSLDSE